MAYSAQMTDPAQIREFVLAGNARLTLVSKKTGARFTYRVRAADGDGPASHFVSVLVGPENSTDYAYLGCFKRGGEVYEHGRKSKIGVDAPSSRAWRWFLLKAFFDGTVPPELEVWHLGACGKCGRALTVPESIARGLGPICAGRA